MNDDEDRDVRLLDRLRDVACTEAERLAKGYAAMLERWAGVPAHELSHRSWSYASIYNSLIVVGGVARFELWPGKCCSTRTNWQFLTRPRVSSGQDWS